ncbi:hypothetical protein [Pseudoalteromonas sp. S16_S37]|uniref:hypothetical protein n=1 Tax=Pseudoalteromonas sp. S16_S37 TaxID=2720228 RepID=UPI0016801A0A|nr:hypothetical protein [Pseudoalteromonas sp. S16_S37]MBD1584288.1 hypothetical protein [Pseudoalteromonas sp. S16_S37]
MSAIAKAVGKLVLKTALKAIFNSRKKDTKNTELLNRIDAKIDVFSDNVDRFTDIYLSLSERREFRAVMKAAEPEFSRLIKAKNNSAESLTRDTHQFFEKLPKKLPVAFLTDEIQKYFDDIGKANYSDCTAVSMAAAEWLSLTLTFEAYNEGRSEFKTNNNSIRAKKAIELIQIRLSEFEGLLECIDVDKAPGKDIDWSNATNIEAALTRALSNICYDKSKRIFIERLTAGYKAHESAIHKVRATFAEDFKKYVNKENLVGKMSSNPESCVEVVEALSARYPSYEFAVFLSGAHNGSREFAFTTGKSCHYMSNWRTKTQDGQRNVGIATWSIHDILNADIPPVEDSIPSEAHVTTLKKYTQDLNVLADRAIENVAALKEADAYTCGFSVFRSKKTHNPGYGYRENSKLERKNISFPTLSEKSLISKTKVMTRATYYEKSRFYFAISDGLIFSPQSYYYPFMQNGSWWVYDYSTGIFVRPK